MKTAVPAAVSWTVARRWMSWQVFAAASQKLTWPRVTAFAAEVTFAVRVTTVPDVTVATDFPAATTEKVVMVAAFASATCERAAGTGAESRSKRSEAFSA